MSIPAEADSVCTGDVQVPEVQTPVTVTVSELHCPYPHPNELEGNTRLEVACPPGLSERLVGFKVIGPEGGSADVARFTVPEKLFRLVKVTVIWD